MLALWLDWMILKVFSNLNDSMTKDCSLGFPEASTTAGFDDQLFNLRCNLTWSGIYSSSTQTAMGKYLQKSNFRQEEKKVVKLKISITVLCYSFDLSCHCLG